MIDAWWVRPVIWTVGISLGMWIGIWIKTKWRTRHPRTLSTAEQERLEHIIVQVAHGWRHDPHQRPYHGREWSLAEAIAKELIRLGVRFE